MSDEELIKRLIPLWYGVRSWAIELLSRSFELEKPNDILKPELRGLKNIPGTNWHFRTHGIGVDVFKTPDTGGIDFDFDKVDPDEWRLKIFFEKQFNDGQLSYKDYMELSDDEDRLDEAIRKVLAEI